MKFLKTLFGKKEKAIQSNSDFWSWFSRDQKDFYKVVKDKGDIEKDFFIKLSPRLNAVKEGMWYLTGMYDNNTVELVITADGNVLNIAFIQELIEAAPKIDGWKFTALKPPLDLNDIFIELGGYQFNRAKLQFYAIESYERTDEIQMAIVHNDLTKDNRKVISNGVYLFLDHYLGELDFVMTIDELTIISREEALFELIPIEKLRPYLTWRQKEFIEKYEGKSHDTANDTYALMEATYQSGEAIIAVINTNLLQWDLKASHPWISIVEIPYDGEQNNGMPEDDDYKLLEKIETEILENLKDIDGYLNIGRQTGANKREVYFACKDFRIPSKVIYRIQTKYSPNVKLTYEIFKDKYWQAFNRFHH